MNFKKALTRSPLIGACFTTIVFYIYYLSVILYNSKDRTVELILNSTWSYIKVLPIVTIIFILVSYILFVPFIIYVYRIKNYYYYTERFCWSMSLLIGLVIGIIISYIEYKYHKDFFRSVAINVSVSIGFLLNSTLLTALQEYQHEK